MLPDRVPIDFVQHLLTTIRRVQGAPGEPEAWATALLEGLLPAFNADVGIVSETLLSENQPSPRIAWFVDQGWGTSDERTVFLRYMHSRHANDPSLDALTPLLQGSDKVFTRRREDLVDDATWYASEYHREYRKPMGLDPQLVSVQKLTTPGWFLSIALHRRRGREPFGNTDRDLLHLVHSQCDWLLDRRSPAGELLGHDLSPRLKDVLHCLLAGQAAKEIAYRLGLSDHTVRGYIKQIYKQLGVSGRGELMSRYAQELANRPIDFQI